MKRFKSLLLWILKAWPALIVVGIEVIRRIILKYANIDNVLMNSVIGQVLPLIGGLVILFSINENFQDFRYITMFTSFKNYLKSCPLKKQNHVLQVGSASMSVTFGRPTFRVQKHWNSTEEGLNELERRIEELYKYMREIKKSNDEDHTKIRSELKNLVDKNDKEIQQVSQRLDKTVMGNVIYQIFGILLIIYGFILNIMLIFQT